MTITKTNIPGLLIIEPKVLEDTRGYFFESYNQRLMKEAGILTNFVQDNQSKSIFGVLRGLHYQTEPFAQAKLVRVIHGKVWDVAVDLRKGSPAYLRWHGEILSSDNKKQLFIPSGFAHGFVVLSETAEFFYKCDNYYSREHEKGIRYDDPELKIDWHLPQEQLRLSEKDRNLPYLREAVRNFSYHTGI
ncbi:MAG TPA: dTDP-4-dehydrorhamnose 3,5-epimerase [Chitinophagales bacterium]|nr:dTDP-4-dehydrorhamnose 3,5-epimerase [Chitinophagales bacterium]